MRPRLSEDAASILNAALKLSEEDRLELADALYESVSMEPDPNDDEFFAELERRRAESERDPSSMIPWSEVKRMLDS